MTQERPADRLMEKLLRAIELSLKATEASREAAMLIERLGYAALAQTEEATQAVDEFGARPKSEN